MKLFKILTISYLKKRPFYFLLTLIAMSLGISVYAAISLANRSVVSALQKNVEASTGGVDYSVFAQAGKLNLQDLVFLSSQKEVMKASPVREIKLVCGEEQITLTGFDFFTRPAQQWQNQSALKDWDKKDSDKIVMSTSLAKLCGMEKDGDYSFFWNQKQVVLPILFSAENSESRLAFTDLSVMEEKFGSGQEFDRVDLLLPHPDPLLTKERVKEIFKNYRILSPQELTQQNQNLTSAFRTNLQAMSGVAVLVAVFLVYNALSLSFFHRRKQLATLLCLGARPSKIYSSLLLEILIFSVLASLIGYALGLVLAQKLMLQVSQTLSALYRMQMGEGLVFSWIHFLETAGVSLLSCVMGSLLPFLELKSISPIVATRDQNYENRFKTIYPLSIVLSLLFFALFALCLKFASSEQAYWGIFSTLVLLLGFAALTPVLFQGGMKFFIWFFRKISFHKSLLVSNQVAQNPYRFSVVIAALSVALSLWLGMSFMVKSFRDTLNVWVHQTINADIYFTSKIHGDNYLPDVGMMKWNNENLFTIRHEKFNYEGKSTEVSISELKRQLRQQTFKFLEGAREEFLNSKEENLVALAEPLARKFKLQVGQTFEVETPYGKKTLTVGAIFYDYTSEQGLIYLERDDYLKWGGDARIHGIAFFFSTPEEKEKLLTQLRPLEKKLQFYKIQTKEEIWNQTLQIFDQTFQVTVGLKLLALVVSLLGVWASLLILSEERRKEMGLLQILGLSSWGAFQVLLIQSLLFSILGVLLGTLSGASLSYVLLKVIHRYYFGWTLFFNFYWIDVLQAFLLTFLASFFAGALVQWKMHKEALSALVRNEE